MKLYYPFVLLLLVACGNHTPTKQAAVPALVDSVSIDPTATIEPTEKAVRRYIPGDSAIGAPIEMLSDKLDNFLQGEYKFDSTFEQLLSLEEKKQETTPAPGKTVITTDLKNAHYHIIATSVTTTYFDYAEEISINGEKIKYYLSEDGDTVDADPASIQQVFAFKSSKHNYLLITVVSLSATGKFRQLVSGLLVNMDKKPYTGRYLTTYMEPGIFYFSREGTTGKMKYITVMPIDNDNVEIAHNIAVQVMELYEP